MTVVMMRVQVHRLPLAVTLPLKSTMYHVYDLLESLLLTLTPSNRCLHQRLLRHALSASLLGICWREESVKRCFRGEPGCPCAFKAFKKDSVHSFYQSRRITDYRSKEETSSVCRISKADLAGGVQGGCLPSSVQPCGLASSVWLRVGVADV